MAAVASQPASAVSEIVKVRVPPATKGTSNIREALSLRLPLAGVTEALGLAEPLKAKLPGCVSGTVCLVMVTKPFTVTPVTVAVVEEIHLDLVLAVILAVVQLLPPVLLLNTKT